MDLETAVEQFKTEYETFLTEYERFSQKGVKVAASRSRKSLLNMGKLSKELRKSILEMKSEKEGS